MAKRGNNQRRWWLLGIMAILTAMAYMYFTDKAENNKSQYHIEKTGAGTLIDYTQGSQSVHSAIDAGLKKTALTAKDIKEKVKEVPNRAVEANIRWHSRQMSVALPGNKNAEAFRQDIESWIRDSGGQVVAAEPDTYQGNSVVRFDVGLIDRTGGTTTLVTDTIYAGQEKNAVAGTKPNSAPSAAVKGRLAFVIDDFGYDSHPIDAFTAISRPFTFAVIPFRQYSTEAATRGLGVGNQIILHLPMEPLRSSEQSEERTITTAMSDDEIQAMAAKAIQAVPGLSGVNNHQGSKATADPRVMRSVLKVVKDNHLFFIDSRTNSQSVAYQTAARMGVKTGENHLFLDNDNDVSAIKRKIQTAGNMAIKYGEVIVIGHARMNTAIAIREMIPELESEGIKIVFASQLLH